MASNSTFPDEIMIEILLKLPVKSILRCNTLSKHYYSLIHSQYFIRRHLNLGRLNGNFNDRLIVTPMVDSLRLFNRKSGCFMELECPSSLVGNVSKLMISGPLDGLYCVINHENVPRRRAITLWNPATLEEFVLPVPPLTIDDEDHWHEGMTMNEFLVDFLAREKILAYGFGFDSNTDSYKFLVIYGSFSDTIEDMFMYIFNVNERTWIYHEEHLGASSWSIGTFVGVFLHGACHWKISFSQRSTHSIRRHPIYKILVFNMSTESSGTILFPDVGDGYNWYDTSITTRNGCLALINANGGNIYRTFSSINVWVMGEYGVTESWSIMYRVSIPHGIGGRYMGITRDRLYVHEGKGEGWLVSYDLDSKDVENYGILDNSIHSLLPYEESLVRIVSSTRRSS